MQTGLESKVFSLERLYLLSPSGGGGLGHFVVKKIVGEKNVGPQNILGLKNIFGRKKKLFSKTM